jgi:hypothetical protein
MKHRLIADNGCTGGTCPTAYLTDRGTAVVQGYVVDDPEALAALGLPAGETAVEVPVELLVEAAQPVAGV